jgi:membrane-associated phospholipid phosphatase
VSERLGLWARRRWAWLLERCAALTVVGAAIASTYAVVGHATNGRHTDLWTSLDTAIPFVPETVWIYFPVYVAVLVALPFFVADRACFYRTLLSMMLAAAMCMLVFFLVPSTMPVPHVQDDGTWTVRFLRFVQAVDVANNTFPSEHVAVAFACAFGAYAYQRGLGTALILLATLVAVSTTTTKQHYWIDSPAGIAVAAIAHRLCFRGRRAETP